MLKIIKKQIRPNTSVDFFVAGESVKDWIASNYIMTGKILDIPSTAISEDGLEMTKTFYWASADDAQLFKDDPYLIEYLHTPRESYLAANGIILLSVSQDDQP